MTAAIADLIAGDAALALEADVRAPDALDAFFTRATSVQARRSTAVDDVFRADARAVFLLYMRLLSVLKQGNGEDAKRSEGSLLAQALHVTRVVPFCQLFAARNPDAVQELLNALVDTTPAFCGSLTPLRAVYCQRFEHLHRAVARAKRAEIVELTHGLYEMSLSLWGVVSPSTTKLLFLGGKNAEEDLNAQESSLIFALVRCYELDLPTLQRHLATFDESHALDKLAVVADTRRILLQVFGAYLDVLMETTDEEPGDPRETLLAVLHALTQCSGCTDCDGGSFLSDMWFLCGLKDKVVDYFMRHEMDSEQLEYLEMIVDGLPKRRIVAREEKSASSKREAPTHLEDEEKQPAASDGDEAALASLVDQVKDFFPDLGDGFIELCLLSSKRQVEVVINFLLESNPPPELLDVPQSLTKSDAEYERAKSRLAGTAPSASASNKLDPSQVWVGKKPQEKEYDPQIGKKDHQFAEKMKQIVAQYEEEDDIVVTGGALPGGVTLDEYDDDYNDEFEDYEPFGVHDGGQLDDQEAIRELNRRIRAKEEEDAFWESMKNPNHRVTPDDEDEEGDGEEKHGDKQQQSGGGNSSSNSKRQVPRPSPNGPSKKPGDKKKGDNKSGADDKQEKEAPTPQQQRARARNTKNKAKVANHHRKERALKKMG